MQNGLERMRSIWAQAKRQQVLHADPYLEIAAQAWGTKSTSNIEMNPDLCAAFASILQREIEKQTTQPDAPNEHRAIREFIRISVIGRGDVPEDVRKGAITVLAIPAAPPEKERYFLDSDDDGHWYLVPDANRAEWMAWRDIPSDDERSWDVPAFAEALGGGAGLLTFTDPIYLNQPRRDSNA